MLDLGLSESKFHSTYFFLIPDSMRKVLKNLRSFLNRMDRLGNRTSWFIGFCFPEQQFGYFALFVSDLSHSELELHSICFAGFPTL